jgi:hypothetical protein
LGRAARRALAAVLVVSAPALAHLRFPALKAERALELRLDEAPIRLRYALAFGPERANAERLKADIDRDLVVSAAEGSAALDARSAELLRTLRVCKGDRLDALECSELSARQIELVAAEGWNAGPAGDLHFGWTFNLGESVESIGALRVEDAFELPGVEITEVRIEPPRGRALAAAGEGSAPQGVTRRLSWIEARRGSGPRILSAVWPPPSRHWVTLAIAAAVVALAAALYWQTRRERASTIG